MAKSHILIIGLAAFITLLVQAKCEGVTIDGQGSVWNDAHATFYGDMSGRETMRK